MPQSRPRGPALLEDHRLRIALPADGRPRLGHRHPLSGRFGPRGAIYKLHEAGLPALDAYEGCPTLYRRPPPGGWLARERHALSGARAAPARAAERGLHRTLRGGYRDSGRPIQELEAALREREPF